MNICTCEKTTHVGVHIHTYDILMPHNDIHMYIYVYVYAQDASHVILRVNLRVETKEKESLGMRHSSFNSTTHVISAIIGNGDLGVYSYICICSACVHVYVLLAYCYYWQWRPRYIELYMYSLLHVECHSIKSSNPNLIGLFSTERGKRDVED